MPNPPTQTESLSFGDALSQAEHELDCLGQKCPMPIVKMARKVREMESGEMLSVKADDPGAIADIPAWCVGSGNTFIGYEQQGREISFVVRKV